MKKDIRKNKGVDGKLLEQQEVVLRVLCSILERIPKIEQEADIKVVGISSSPEEAVNDMINRFLKHVRILGNMDYWSVVIIDLNRALQLSGIKGKLNILEKIVEKLRTDIGKK